MQKMKIGMNGIEKELPEEDKKAINEALYYAVRENFNDKVDESKTQILRKALDIMKEEKKKPVTSHMCNISLNDFFRACEVRGWTDELYEISWLEVG